jgi:hypothetical protein
MRDNPGVNTVELVITPPVRIPVSDLDAIDWLRAAFARGPVSAVATDPDSWWLARLASPSGVGNPAGAYRTAGTPGGRYRLCADPVHLEVHGDGVVLDASVAAGLTVPESEALVACLTAHFSADRMSIRMVSPSEWVIDTDQQLQFSAPPLRRVHGRSIEPHMPSGPDGPRLRRLATEAQMLLHAAPANDQLSARGMPSINGIWLWGGGEAVALPPMPGTALLSDATHLRAMAAGAGCETGRLPESAKGLDRIDRYVLVDLDGRLEDPESWLRKLRSDWLAPLSEAKVPVQAVVNLPRASVAARLFRLDLFGILRRGGLHSALERRGLHPDTDSI